jgi:hypothetical protein
MMLNSMQVLPVANISQIALFDNQIEDTTSVSEQKRKRKTPDQGDNGRCGKKKGGNVAVSSRTTRRSVASKTTGNTSAGDDSAMEMA